MRKTLLFLSALGLAASGLTTAKIFSASTDTAKVDGIRVSSGPITPPQGEGSVDLQLASFDGQSCGTYGEDLSVENGATVYQDLVDGSLGQYCVRNAGDAIADISITPLVVSSTEVNCAEGEAAVDPTCTKDAQGELEHYTRWSLYRVSDGTLLAAGRSWTSSLFAGSLHPGEVKVFGFSVRWSAAPEQDPVVAATDTMVVRFTFDGSIA